MAGEATSWTICLRAQSSYTNRMTRLCYFLFCTVRVHTQCSYAEGESVLILQIKLKFDCLTFLELGLPSSVNSLLTLMKLTLHCFLQAASSEVF